MFAVKPFVNYANNQKERKEYKYLMTDLTSTL